MAITDRERVERRNWVGASDVPILFGLARRTPYDLFIEKTGKLEQLAQEKRELSRREKAADLGKRLEPALLDFAEEELGALQRNVHVGHRPGGLPLEVNLDGLLIEGNLPVEAKTAGLLSLGPRERWGDEGTDEVPENVLLQVQAEMLGMATKPDFSDAPQMGHVVAYVGGRGIVMYRVPFSMVLGTAIAEKVTAFWNHVLLDTPPENSEPSLEVIRRTRRVPGKIIDLEDSDMKQWLDEVGETNRLIKELEERRDKADARIHQLLGDAEAGVSPTLGGVTYFWTERKMLDLKKLRATLSNVADFEYPTRFRQLRKKKAGTL